MPMVTHRKNTNNVFFHYAKRTIHACLPWVAIILRPLPCLAGTSIAVPACPEAVRLVSEYLADNEDMDVR